MNHKKKKKPKKTTMTTMMRMTMTMTTNTNTDTYTDMDMDMDMDMDDRGKDPDLSCLALAHNNFRQVHINSLKRIKSRVHNYEEINAQLLKGLDLFQRTGDESGFIDFTGSMLQYYDKMYSYQMSQRKGEVLFRGDSKAIIEWTESEEGRRRLAML